MSRLWFGRTVVAVAACYGVAMYGSASHSRSMSGIQAGGAAKPAVTKASLPSTKDLGGTERFLTLISTDKPIYKASEKVYVRGVLLNATNHKPLEQQIYNARIEITGPKGDIVASGNAATVDSVWAFAWEVPEGQAGGEYTVNVNYPWEGHPPAERKFDIRAYRAPRLKSQITFLRDGYGPGEKVTATLDVKRAEGGVPVGAKVTVSARVDGIAIKAAPETVNESGLCTVNFDLPPEIPRGEGTLALIIEDGGVVETASKTIPILLQTVDLQIFPEGGDLLAGFKNRVYIQAKQPNGKPADLSGKIMLKGRSQPVAEFKTEHEGRGRFEFAPEENKEYYLSISKPAGIKTTYPLPRARAEGAVLRTEGDIVKRNAPVRLLVGSTKKNISVTLAKKEVQLAKQVLDQGNRAGQLQPVVFNVPAELDGVLTVTVWDQTGVPLAERLIFRQPASPIKVSIEPDKKTYVPGDKTKLKVKTTDASGKPVSAVVGLTVTDDSVLEMVEKREQAPRLPVMLYLEPEVIDLADAQVYLDPDNPKAPLATDLLMGTQGWRRYALMNLVKFLEKNGDPARRVVALKMSSEEEIQKAAKLEGADFGGAVRGHVLGKAIPPPPPQMAAPGRPPAPGKPAAQGPLRARFNFAPNKKQIAVAPSIPRPKAKADKLDIPRPKPAAMPAPAKGSFGFAVAAESSVPRQKMYKAIRKRRRAANIVAADEMAMPMSNLILVKEFVHQVRPGRKANDRVDFTETLYWNSGIKTDATTGEATVAFGLNDSVSTFRVLADAFSTKGSLGSASKGIESVQPFYVEAKLPLEVTAGDQIQLPISLVNATTTSLPSAAVKVDMTGDFRLPALQKSSDTINASQRIRWIQPIKVGIGNGAKDFKLSANAGTYSDNVSRKLTVKPKGFPIEATFGGMLEPNRVVTHKISIPKVVVAGSLVSNTGVYPTPLANMTGALERMIQDPNGCFEQTSSTSYPLTMAQQYFMSHIGVNPTLVETSKRKLDAGYKRLVSFWCPDRGYEWFGEDPGHEALTAFGLLHFSDMAKVREVDKNMIATTRSWLMKQRDGKGGFARKRRSLHTWIEDKDCSDAYIVWALLESGQDKQELSKEITALKSTGTTSPNSYVQALAANALHIAGDTAESGKLMAKLASRQKADGSVSGIKSSIVGSGGESLAVEGTALATLAWLRDPAYAGNVEKSIKYLADSCQAGRYGSTQATVLALRAIVNYDKQRSKPKAPGKVRVIVDGQPVGDWVTFTKTTQGTIKLPDMAELLTPGEHQLQLKMEGGGAMPYSMAVKYNAETPATSSECKLDLNVSMAQTKVAEGAATEANVVVSNKTDKPIPTPVAIIGIPGGLEPRHAQLKELVKKKKIDAYEVIGRDVVLYWRSLAENSKVEFPISLIAAVPGTYTGPASRAYLYYTDEHKKWVEGLKVEIAAK